MRRTAAGLAVVLAACHGKGDSKTRAPCDRFAATWLNGRVPLVVGHRGTGNIGAPENTFAAFDAAVSVGAALETDVRTTSDGVPVIMHDETVDRTTGGTGTVTAMTLDELLRLDAAYVYRSDLF